MKYFLILFLGISTCVFGQGQNVFPYKNADLTSRIHNKDMFYAGEADKDKFYKIKFESIKKNIQKPERYLVEGVTNFQGNRTPFKGEIIFKEKFDVKNEAESVLLFGDFNFEEESDDENPGIFTGKIRIQTDKEMSPTQHGATVTFKGELKKGEHEIHQIWFSNFTPHNIDKVIFR